MKIIGIAAGVLAFAGVATPARAQATREGEMVIAPLRAPRHAFELGADLGYTQGFGSMRDGRSVRDLAGAGLGLGIGLGYRATPLFSIAATGQIQGFDPSSSLPAGTAVRGATAGFEATFHLAPYDHGDPWLSLGSGYRMLWEVPPGTATATLTHGFEVGRLAVGLDVRPSANVAIAPMIGVGVDLFNWRSSSEVENAMLEGTGVSAFLFAGVRGRFDVGGTRVSKIERVSATGSR